MNENPRISCHFSWQCSLKVHRILPNSGQAQSRKSPQTLATASNHVAERAEDLLLGGLFRLHRFHRLHRLHGAVIAFQEPWPQPQTMLQNMLKIHFFAAFFRKLTEISQLYRQPNNIQYLITQMTLANQHLPRHINDYHGKSTFTMANQHLPWQINICHGNSTFTMANQHLPCKSIFTKLSMSKTGLNNKKKRRPA